MPTGALLFALALFSPEASSPDTVLARVREKIRDVVEHMPRYTCTQTIDRRYVYRVIKSRDCDRAAGAFRKGVRGTPMQTDRVRLDVAMVETGAEVYSWAGESRLESVTAVDIIGGGPFTTGQFGLFLADIFTGTPIPFEFLGERKIHRDRMFEYRFRMPLAQSHYRVEAGAASRIIAYDGSFLVDPDSAELRSLKIRTAELPPESGNCEATTTVDFARTRIGQGEFLLPHQSTLSFIGRGNWDSENSAVYAGCHEYHAESVLRFETSEGAADKPAAGGGASALPSGVKLSMAFTTAIDMSKSAAGDVLMAEVQQPAADPRTGRILIKRGAAVRCRIIRLEHHLGARGYYMIAVLPETIQAGGSAIPLAANPHDEIQVIGSIQLLAIHTIQAQTKEIPGARFVFMAGDKNLVVPRGLKSEWYTE